MLSSISRVLYPLAGALLLSISPAQAQTPADACLAANNDLTLGAPLPKTAALLKANKPVRIVGIGSSSTVGLWQMDPAKNYLGRMRSEIERLVPGVQLEIVNSGRNGDTIPGNIARFERDVFAHRPDLIIWQLGSNDLTWGDSTGTLQERISEAVKALRANGADVVLMDQQYTPVIIATSYGKMQDAIDAAAQQDKVPLFRRFDMMHRAVEAGVSLGALSAFDGLHMSGEAYECVGRALARAIFAAVQSSPTPASPKPGPASSSPRLTR